MQTPITPRKKTSKPRNGHKVTLPLVPPPVDLPQPGCDSSKRALGTADHRDEERTAEAGLRYLNWRRLADQTVALALLFVCSPVLLVLLLAVKLTSKGPAIYTQERVGLGGRTFTIFKFRSMCCDAESGSGAVWSQPGDPRVTPVGRLLRWSHLDELPQLVNILRGDMALIGPRPERPEIVRQLRQQIPGYDQRHCVVPGVTGLAQVSLPPDSSIDSVRRKTILDQEYIRTASLALDCHILLCTIMLLFGLQRRLDSKVWAEFA